MIFVDYPYISHFLKETLRDHGLPVVETPAASELGLLPGTRWISEEQAQAIMTETVNPAVYATSENAFGWISRQAAFGNLSRKIELFKNKAAFRRLVRPMFPDFRFREIPSEALESFPLEELPFPCIIKPAVGFFSLGVYKINSPKEWPETIAKIRAEMERIREIYPAEVLNLDSFLVEECIEGEEFAVDAYYTPEGDPVILGIWEHRFSTDADVNDRVYSTSRALVETHLDEFTDFVGEIGRLADVKNFPIHVELRKTPEGLLVPIEVNPLRFGGWCTTADGTYKAYGLNPYVAYYEQQRPDWGQLLKKLDGKVVSIIVLDNSTGLDGGQIAAFDYDQLLSGFENPLELRKVDYRQYPLFGFVFTESEEAHVSELDAILHSTLREFVKQG